MGINVASKYASKVDERMTLKELTNIGLNTEYNWDNVDTITVYSIDTVGLNNYTKSGTSRYGTPAELSDTTKSYKLETDKAFTYTIDEFYKKSQMGVKQAGKSLAREIDEVVVPFRDKQRLKVWTDTAKANSNVIVAAQSKTTAYAKVLEMEEKLDEAKFPQANRVLYVTPAFLNILKQDANFIKSGDMSQKMLVKGQVGEIDGVRIVKVPSSYFDADYYAVLVYTKSTISPSKLREYKIHSNPPGINGDLIEGRFMLDTFVLEQKAKGVVALKATAVSAS